MFVEVALPLPLLKTFHYRCSGASFERLEPGQRVLVPFKNRQLTAYVIRTFQQRPASLPADVPLKEVIGLVDSASLVSTELFQLARWISDYYFAPRGEVLRACLPPRMNLRTRQVAAVTMAGLDACEQIASLPDLTVRDKEILRLLAENKLLDFRQLGKLLGSEITAATLQRLSRPGWVEIRHDLDDSVISARQQRVVSLREPSPESASLSDLTPLQAKVIEHLKLTSTPVPASRLLESLQLSSSVLKSLEKRGWLVITRENVQRDPFKSIDGFSSVRPSEHTAEQRQVLEELRQLQRAGLFAPTLLHGVTGSGKTEVYQCLIEETVASRKSALLLMPEIGLTPRIAQEFRQRFGTCVAILHSGLSDGERFDEWWRIQRGEARVVIGTRSALFAPLRDVGLIVVDEEHDPSYKQQESPRYHARDCALVRGKLANALVILGSATPAIETFFNARSGKYRYLRLTSRVQSRPLPDVTLVDMREEFRRTGKNVIFSEVLKNGICERLERKEQVLILLNRRGFSASVLCRSCGQNIQCRNCSISLTFHRAANRLCCHYCSYEQRVPRACPRCSSEYLYFQREGTEKVEALLEKTFPNARISRLDRDTVRKKGAHVEILSEFQRGETDILTGTQMISKGHDFHNVTLVGILSADTSLSFPDFRCAERTFHLLSQMSGRAGRGDLAGQVLIQTFHPEHYCLKFVVRHDYEGFFDKEIKFRRLMHYPPFTGIVSILVRDRKLEAAASTISAFGKIVQELSDAQMRILGPTLSPLAKLKNEHRFQMMIKAESRLLLRQKLNKCLERAESEGIDLHRIHIDVDPVNIM